MLREGDGGAWNHESIDTRPHTAGSLRAENQAQVSPAPLEGDAAVVARERRTRSVSGSASNWWGKRRHFHESKPQFLKNFSSFFGRWWVVHTSIEDEGDGDDRKRRLCWIWNFGQQWKTERQRKQSSMSKKEERWVMNCNVNKIYRVNQIYCLNKLVGSFIFKIKFIQLKCESKCELFF